MDLISLAEASALVQVILVDLVLAGDNAIVVGLAAAGLPASQRGRAIVIGIAAAVVMRILFALVTVQLLHITGLLVVGGLLLLWVCSKLWHELGMHAQRAAEIAAVERGESAPESESETKTYFQAVVQIVIADLSMSLDNVLAVAGVARDHAWVLVVGLALSVLLMGAAAVVIARLLSRHIWIGYVGLAVIVYVAVAMLYEGTLELRAFVAG